MLHASLQLCLVMCRNIKTLFNFEPPATELEIRDAALQFVRKLSGFTVPSKANEAAFDQAVAQVADAARGLIGSLVTNAEPRDREIEAERARARSRARFGVRDAHAVEDFAK
jgi:hypothetical protein